MPKSIIDNPRFGRLADRPFAFWVEARDALAGQWLFDVAQPVPDQVTDIDLVVDETRSALHMTADRGVFSRLAVRAGNAPFVQCEGNCPWSESRSEFPDNAADHIRFGLVDLPGADHLVHQIA